jgi:hypothetical protein
MGRDAKAAANTNIASADTRASGYGTTAGTDSSAITPYFQRNLVNPSGYTPAQTAQMLTSSSQSLGGSTAAALGSGDLLAARDRNAAGVSSVGDDVVRNAMKQQSTNALGVDTASTNLANQRQSDAASGLSSLYNTNTSALLSSLGLSNAAIGQLTAADEQSSSNWKVPLQAATSVAAAYAGKPS